MTPAKGYAKMKDSGIEWVGMIPATWDVFPAGGVFDEVKEKNVNNQYSNPFSFRYGEIVDKKIAGEIDESVEETLSAYRVVSPNTIMINGLNLNYDFISQRVAIVREKGIITSAYLAVQPDEGRIVPRFVLYLLKAYDYRQVFHGVGSGIRKTLKFQDFKSIKIVAPSLTEQTAIASYLDAQCAKIDEIIAQAKASIEDYKQWKASIIYEAVTKGLDPNVEMKDSGIPCVDKVPKHWTVTRFGKIAAVKSNLVNPKDYQSYKQISPENIEKGSGVLLDCVTVEESGVISGNHLFYKGQILYSKIRPTLNKVIIAPFDGLCSADMYPIDTDHCSRFILYLMLSAYFNEQVALVTGNRVKMPKINQNELSQIMVAIPSDTEEQQIAKYLDLSCSQIDVLIKEKQSLIDDLESYKKSLIYEVVTGKRRV